jgi:ribosomal-protein-alanine N-acetyltransferase
MARQGRFGKYGDSKRKERLRKGALLSVKKRALTDGPIQGFRPSGGKVFVRDAVESDKGFIKELSKEAFEKYGPYENMIPEWLGSGAVMAFLACRKKRLLGFAMISRPVHENRTQPLCELLAIAVVRASRGNGIGRLMMVEAEKRAAEMGAVAIVLHAAVGNLIAQKLFKKSGFVPCSIKKRYYPNGQEAIMMKKSVKQE